MGVASTNSKSLAHGIALATGQELKSVGINWILGPVLDVLSSTDARSQPLGVRSCSDNPQEASLYGVNFIKGYQQSGLATCGKHFPSYGNLQSPHSPDDVPAITESLEQLGLNALVPFRHAISHNVDAMLVGGVSMSAAAGPDIMHACLSEQVVDDLLRRDLGFNGVVVSECLEMEALSHNIGVGGGTVMAKNAGCDIMLSCHSFRTQQEAINGLKLGAENGIIDMEDIERSLRRVLQMKTRCTLWEQALNPPGVQSLAQMQSAHTKLSVEAYDSSITVVRDKNSLLPLSNVLEPDDELLLLTPLVKPMTPMNSEIVFQELGRSVAWQRNGRVLHTSYTANGVRPVHESLIDRASAVVVVTADGNRNMYQQSFTKHVSLICRAYAAAEREKPLIVAAVSSPYDFATDMSVDTYVCTYDFSQIAQRALVKVLVGEVVPTGTIPGSARYKWKLHQQHEQRQRQRQQESRRQNWLVESWQEERDTDGLNALLDAMVRDDSASELQGIRAHNFLLRRKEIEEWHFVVRNSSTGALYGFCSTYYFLSTRTGVIGALIVDPSRRRRSIGRSLHNRAMQRLQQVEGLKRMQLGSRLPGIYLGIPASSPRQRKRLRQWFSKLGWNTGLSRPVSNMILHDLESWKRKGSSNSSSNNSNNSIGSFKDEEMDEEEEEEIGKAGVSYDLVYGWEEGETILEHVHMSTRQGVEDIYRLALEGPNSAVIRARRKGDDGMLLLGSVVIYSERSRLAELLPTGQVNKYDDDRYHDHDDEGGAGGLSSPVISPLVGEYAIVVQGLIELGIKQLRRQGAREVVFDCVSGMK